MTGPRGDRDAPLKAAFRDLAAASDEACTTEEVDRIWRAAAGDLDADSRRDLVDRMAASPAAAATSPGSSPPDVAARQRGRGGICPP